MNISLLEQVKEILHETLGTINSEMTEDTLLVQDLGMDSLAEVELVMALEEKFNIVLSDEESQKMKTLGDVVRLIKREKTVV